MAPSVVEFLFALGAGERVVGVGDYCFHPPEAKLLPRIGGEYNPNFERILALKPDLLIAQGRAEKLEDFCRRNAVPILRVNTDTLATLRSGLHELGRAVGLEAEADRLAARIQTELAAVASRVAGRPRPKVFLCMSHSPGSLRGLSTAHGASLLSELLDIAGGQNVLGDVPLSYPPVSKDQLLERQPDAILDLHPGEELSDEARRLLLADWAAMASLPAVRSGRVHLLTDDSLLVPGPRVPAVARRLAQVLHPGAMRDEVQ
ncbi:MAG: cobalamin-binding protein [Planctomycetes bacterium]|nr:cobalamin-binding protein [Planctomycetota bacterium]